MVFELTPAYLSAVCVLHGQPPLPIERPLTWLDLGTGTGVSALMVAATNPTMDVWGVDLNPVHVERGRSLARRAQVDNASFLEASFAELADDDDIGPAEADVIVINGAYSWISEENQGHVTEIIRRRLRPGGLAYVMYEVPTGWSGAVPVTDALRLHAAADGRRGDQAFHAAAAAVHELADAGARSFPLAPREAKLMAEWESANALYAAHEYFGSNFGPLMFDEVAGPLDAARCSFVGGAEIIDHLPFCWTPPQFTDLLTAMPDVTIREMTRDLITQRALRRDLYRRGLAMPAMAEHEQCLRELVIVGLGKPFEDKPMQVSGGEIALDPTYHRPLVDALVEGPLDALRVMSIHPDWNLADAGTAMALQVAAGYAAPAQPGSVDERAVAAARRLNEVLATEVQLGYDHSYLVAPALGGGIGIDLVEFLAISSVWNGADEDVEALTAYVMECFDDTGRVVREEGSLIRDPEAARVIVAQRVGKALGRLHDLFPRLGIA
jgi:predicted O-methyltransferase YrrM